MNTSEFLASLARAITGPTYQPRFSTDDYIALANECMVDTVVPEIRSCREEYFVNKTEVDVVAGQEKIPIPNRSVGRTLREIHWQGDSQTTINLPRIQIEDVFTYTNLGNGTPAGFYMMADGVYPLPIPSQPGTCILYYNQYPNNIVPVSQTATVESVGDSTITVTTLPNIFIIGTEIDVISGTPGYQLAIDSATISNVSGTTITLAGYSPSNPIIGVAAGDCVSITGTTSIIQLPLEGSLCLVQATALRVVETLAIAEHITIKKERYEKVLANLYDSLTPRVAGEMPVVYNNNGLLRGRLLRTFPAVTV